MEIQIITYRGRSMAACTATRVFISDELEARGLDDPVTRFVMEMCIYAGQVLNGLLPGPYRNEDARSYARTMLVPGELLEHPAPLEHLDVDATAEILGLPADELRVELA